MSTVDISRRITEAHDSAMDFALQADICRAANDIDQAKELYRKAFLLEKEATDKAIEAGYLEPERSILLRSAATLAYDCGEYVESEKLIYKALVGDPCPELEEEFKDLLEKVNFGRHFDLKGLTLQENEVRLVIAGHGVGNGIAKTDDVMNRVKTFNDLTTRTVERLTGKEYRKTSRASKEISSLCESYIQTLPAASLAVSIKYGSIKDAIIPGIDTLIPQVFDDICKNVTLVNDFRVDELKESIPDEDYRMNFLSSVKKFAPDGDNVSMCGITFMKSGRAVNVKLDKTQKEIEDKITSTGQHSDVKKDQTYTFKGVLKKADAKQNRIAIMNSDGTISLTVPNGLSNIVVNNWDKEVNVSYDNNHILLDIERL